MLQILLQLIAPFAIATYLALSMKWGGWRRLWRDAGVMTAALAVLVALQPRVTFYHRGPLNAAGLVTLPIPLGVLAAAIVVSLMAHRRIPMALRIAVSGCVAFLVGFASTWIA